MESRTKTIKLFVERLKTIELDSYSDIKEKLIELRELLATATQFFMDFRQTKTSVQNHLRDLNLITDAQFLKELNYSKSEIDELLGSEETEDFDRFFSFRMALLKYALKKTRLFSRERKKILSDIKLLEKLIESKDKLFNMAINGINIVNKHIKLIRLKDGDISVLSEITNAPILLNRDEKCYLMLTGIELYEDRAVRDTVGGYDGFSFRVARGVSYRIGGFSSRGESHMEKRLIDKGIFYVTNKRYIFDGSAKNIEGELKKVISVEAYSDGIKISRANKRDEVFVGMMDGEYIGAVISCMVKNMDTTHTKSSKSIGGKMESKIILWHDGLSERIKLLLEQIRYEERFLTKEEKQELLERWHDGVECSRDRIAMANEPDVAGFVIGLKYSAICDGRSCDFCRSHNGEVLKIGDLRIKENTPPIHLGCRCMWVPVTKIESEKEEIKFHWNDIKKPDFSLITF